MAPCTLSPRAASYIDGVWTEVSSKPIYNLRNENGTHEKLAGWCACHDAQRARLRPRRDNVTRRYEWTPHNCTLRSLEQSVEATCAKLKGRRVSFIGDSVCQQQFVSVIHLLDGNINARSTLSRSVHEHEVRACNSTVALRSIRTDLLLWEASRRMVEDARHFRFYPILSSFNSAAIKSDVVVLCVGQHYANTGSPFYDGVRDSWGKNTQFGSQGLTWHTVFQQSLNATLSSMLASRRLLGFPRSSVVLMSTTKPVPRCWEYDEPIGSAAEIQRWPHGDRVYPSNKSHYALQWEGWHRHRETARRVAAKTGVAFLDMFPLAGKRPDATIGRHYLPPLRKIGNRTVEWGGVVAEGDCVHFCLPGPPDTWSRLLFNHVLDELDWRSPSPSQSRMQSEAWLEYPSSYIMGAREHLNAAEKLQEKLQTPWWWPYRTALYTVRGLQTQLKILNKTWCKAKEQLHAMNASEATKQDLKICIQSFTTKQLALQSQLELLKTVATDSPWPPLERIDSG